MIGSGPWSSCAALCGGRNVFKAAVEAKTNRFAGVSPRLEDGIAGAGVMCRQTQTPRNSGRLLSRAVMLEPYQKLYSSKTVYARPRGSAMRGSQAAPAAKSFWWAVNGGSLSVRFLMPKPILKSLMPLQITL
ncbi:hypothetical protein BH23PSE2_BH23PSE2_03630 [soil metagenome]